MVNLSDFLISRNPRRKNQVTPEPQKGSQSTSSSSWCAAAVRRRSMGEAKTWTAGPRPWELNGIFNGNLMGTEWDFNGIYIIRCLWTSLLSGCFWNPMMRIINHNRDYVYQPFLQTTFCQTCFPTISMVFIRKFMDIKTCWRHFWYLRYVMVSQLTPKTCW